MDNPVNNRTDRRASFAVSNGNVPNQQGDAGRLSLSNGCCCSAIKRGSVFTTYDQGLVLCFFDTMVSFSALFLIESSSDIIMGKDVDIRALMMALLCFFHTMVYWLNIHHWMRFHTKSFRAVQVWGLILVCLGFAFYPLTLKVWVEEGNNRWYYIVNLAIILIFTLLNFTFENGNGNKLYCLYKKFGLPVALVWYGTAFVLKEAGLASDWMIYVAPFLYMFPLGGEKGEIADGGIQRGLPRYSAFYLGAADASSRMLPTGNSVVSDSKRDVEIGDYSSDMISASSRSGMLQSKSTSGRDWLDSEP